MFKAYITAAALLIFSSLAFADDKKIAKDLLKLDSKATADVIVQFKTPLGSAANSKIAARGGAVQRNHAFIKAMRVRLPAAALAALAKDSDVAFISPNRKIRPHLNVAPGTVGAEVARSYGWTGQGIGIAILDSGVNPSPDLMEANGTTSRIVYSESFVGGNTSDGYGHGTHVAGIAAGNAAQSTGSSAKTTYRGIAPSAKIINLKVLDDTGAGTDASLIAGIERAIALKNTYNIRVLNLSVGRGIMESHATDPLCQAVEAAWRAGLVVVVAAGNEGRNNSLGTEGYGMITAPGNDPLVITVGAMKTAGTTSKSDDTITTFSSKGPSLLDHVVKPDLVAPGNSIVSLRAENSYLDRTYTVNRVPNSEYLIDGAVPSGSGYYRMSGTSMAAPVVAGAAALLLQKSPSLTPDQVKARLMKTASKSFPTTSSYTDPVTGQTFTAQYDIFTIGSGYLDIWAALNDTDVLPAGSAQSPSVTFNSTNNTVSIVLPNGVLWGSSVTWGTSTVWGSGVLWGTSTVWGTGVVWGASAAQASSTVWGTSVIWGSSVVWGSSTTVSGESVPVELRGEK